ncbi:hypothetical protein [Roseateles sp.]|uniref:hypothetical protein n=1 Tax=Roseateles sp. TaxID=1971397 RepID=UPI00326523E6
MLRVISEICPKHNQSIDLSRKVGFAKASLQLGNKTYGRLIGQTLKTQVDQVNG